MRACTAANRTLGVLGGMGPAATAEFLRLLTVYSPARSDQEHPRVILLSDPAIPERSAAVLNGDREAAVRIRAGLRTLVDWGADLLAVPCNTAHAFMDQVRSQVPAPVVDIVDACLLSSMRNSPEGAWLTATNGTLASGMYQDRASALGYQLLLPESGVQGGIHEVSVLVKANHHQEAARRFAGIARSLWEQKSLPLLGACTELPLAYVTAGLPPALMVSSLDALAQACVRELFSAATPRPTLEADW